MKQILNRLSLQSKILFGYVCIVIVFFATGLYVLYSYAEIRQTVKEIDTQSKKLRKIATLEALNRKLVDVTVSFASSGDLKWDVVYTDTKLSYEQQIADITNLFDDKEKKIFHEFLQEGISLRNMEMDIFSTTRKGKTQGSEMVYANEHDQHVIRSAQILQNLMVDGNKQVLYKFRETDAYIHRVILAICSIFILVICMTLLFAYTISVFISRPIQELSQLVNQYALGKFDTRVTVKSQDEIGTLGESFNEMAGKLQMLYLDLEGKVRERTRVLEEKSKEFEKRSNEYADMNKLMIGRELKMVELKKEIEQLKKSTSAA